MERAGNTHFWFDWTVSTPVHIQPDTVGGFRPCGADGSSEPVEVAPGPIWWCFRQTSPTLADKELDQLRKSPDSRLWIASFVTYRNNEGRIRHARLCQIYNFEADRFERSRRESCDWFD
jgi:hypothetical protein